MPTNNAPHGPHVDGRRVDFLAQQDFRGAVPESHHLVCERLHRVREAPRQAEVCDFEVAIAVDEQVLGFQVAV